MKKDSRTQADQFIEMATRLGAEHAVVFNVFKTVHRFDLPLKTLRDEDEQQNWYSAVFIE